VLPNTDVLSLLQTSKNCGEKVDLGKGYWNPKRNMWGGNHVFFRDNEATINLKTH